MAHYSSHNCHPVHELFYTWAGWPSEERLFPPEPAGHFFANLGSRWQTDGLTLLTRTWKPELIQPAFSVTPRIAPTFFTQRVKGRLQHALREDGTPVDFSRKVGMRAIGENVTDVVENHLAFRGDVEHMRPHAFGLHG